MILTKTKPFGRRKRSVNVPPAGPAALTLVSALFDYGSAQLFLTFDRAIDISAFNPASIVVNDGVYNHKTYAGAAGAVIYNSKSVYIPLTAGATYSTPSVSFSATASTGIRATNDYGLWAGVTGQTLPFN